MMGSQRDLAPIQVIIMGVSGCGKTTVGRIVADALNVPYFDADAFHSDANKAKMHAGIPLTDDDRRPWLLALRTLLLEHDQEGRSLVLACSALKQNFRSALIEGVYHARYVYLKGSFDLIASRLADRKDHYMNPALLGSQFEALEEPRDAVVVDVSPGPEAIACCVLTGLGA